MCIRDSPWVPSPTFQPKRLGRWGSGGGIVFSFIYTIGSILECIVCFSLVTQVTKAFYLPSTIALKSSTHELLTIYGHVLRSQSRVTVCAHDLLSRSTITGLRSRSALTIYGHGLRSRSTLTGCGHDLFSRSAVTTCSHDLRS